MGSPLQPGDSFALEKYKVKKSIGQGSYGEVYLVTNTALDREEALKVLEDQDDFEQVRSLLAEARISLRFRGNPNIVEVYDANWVMPYPGCYRAYFTMEYFSEGSLAKYLATCCDRQLGPSAEETVGIVKQICRGLVPFHSANPQIVHRDIKPHNILIDTKVSRYCVSDFGIAKAVDVSGVASVAGNRRYKPPEAWEENPNLSAAADVWAIGCICYELLTLKFPFRLREFGVPAFDEVLRPASEANPTVDKSLDGIIAKALCVNRAERYQTASELLADLKRWKPDRRITPDRYQVLKKDDGTDWVLGSGGMGITYKALDTRLGRAVALKVINETSLANQNARERFSREAKLAAKLRHPNVAMVLDSGHGDDGYFYVSELIVGSTVDEHVRKNGPFHPVEALDIALQVTKALSAAAKNNLIHRDLKPSNIMLETDDEGKRVAKVIDFGLAKDLNVIEEESGTMGLTTGFVGTPQYASPEQLEHSKLDIRTDFYSLGATIYFMLTGQPPFSGSLARIISQHLDAPLPLEPLKHLPTGIVSLVKRLMAKDPEERPTTPEILKDEMLACVRETAAEQRQREEQERQEAERREAERKERLEAEWRQKREQDRLECEQREKERLEAERGEREQLEDVPKAQLFSPVAPWTPTAEPAADKPSAETPKLLHPLPSRPPEPERVKPEPPSSGGVGKKSPSKEVIAFLAIATGLVVAGLIYLAVRVFHSSPPIAGVTTSPTVTATPTVEEKAPPTPKVASRHAEAKFSIFNGTEYQIDKLTVLALTPELVEQQNEAPKNSGASTQYPDDYPYKLELFQTIPKKTSRDYDLWIPYMEKGDFSGLIEIVVAFQIPQEKMELARQLHPDIPKTQPSGTPLYQVLRRRTLQQIARIEYTMNVNGYDIRYEDFLH